MRVLFVHRKGIFDYKGGEQDQITNTKTALARLGVSVRLADAVPNDCSSYDIIHFFGLDGRHIPQIRRAEGIPKVLTPVFWDKAQGYLMDTEFEEWPRFGRETLDKSLYFLSNVSGWRNWRVTRICRERFYNGLHSFAEFQSVIDDIDVFLPNSEAEMLALRTFYVIRNPIHRVIPNAVNLEVLDRVSDFAERTLPRDIPIVCCSGGIDRRKNQFSLVKAMLEIDVPLVFAGASRDRRYFQGVLRAAARRRHTYFVGHLEPPDLHSLYCRAAVHALPSFHDTPGISNLEAVAHECVNVSTQIGGLREYLGDYSLYCNPFSIDHIKQQVVAALNMPPNIEGARKVRSSFTYEHAAAATRDAYSELLQSEGGCTSG